MLIAIPLFSDSALALVYFFLNKSSCGSQALRELPERLPTPPAGQRERML
jgi:hypothetical protein